MKKYLFMVLLSLAIAATACGKSAEEPKVDIAEVNTTESEEVTTENLVSENGNSNNSDGENQVMESASNDKNSAELLGATYIVEDEYSLDDLVEWDGEGEWKSNNVKYLGQCQYYKGKFYCVDRTFNESIGEEFPVEEVTYFLFTDDVLYFMKNDGKYSYNEDGCYDLYQYDLRTKEQTLLENSVSGAAYEDGIVLYKKFHLEYDGIDEELVVGKIDAKTHEKIDEVKLGMGRGILGYDCNNVYFSSDGYYRFSFEDRKTTELSKYKGSNWLCYRNGNIWTYAKTTEDMYAYIELYQQGGQCGRVIYSDYEEKIWHGDSIFYVVDGCVMEYNLKNCIETKVCELSSDGTVQNVLGNVMKCETGEYIIVESVSEGNDGSIPVFQYYLVDPSGNKTKLASSLGLEQG